MVVFLRTLSFSTEVRHLGGVFCLADSRSSLEIVGHQKDLGMSTTEIITEAT